MGDIVRILVADDHPLTRDGIKAALALDDEFEVVGEASDGQEAVDMAEAIKPDVVLMDVRMPDMDGIEATRRICAAPDAGGTRILMLTMFDLDSYVYAALRAGASGFLLKDTPPQELLAAIRSIAGGDSLPGISARRDDPV